MMLSCAVCRSGHSNSALARAGIVNLADFECWHASRPDTVRSAR